MQDQAQKLREMVGGKYTPGHLPPTVGCVYAGPPKGIKFIGDGTLPSPIDVVLSGVYAAAPDLLDACEYVLDLIHENEAELSEIGVPQGTIQNILRLAIEKAKNK